LAKSLSNRLTDAELWELRYWDEKVKNAQIVLGVCEGERAQTRARILAAHRWPPDARVDDDGQLIDGGE